VVEDELKDPAPIRGRMGRAERAGSNPAQPGEWGSVKWGFCFQMQLLHFKNPHTAAPERRSRDVDVDVDVKQRQACRRFVWAMPQPCLLVLLASSSPPCALLKFATRAPCQQMVGWRD
jgi:hypothetical protein